MFINRSYLLGQDIYLVQNECHGTLCHPLWRGGCLCTGPTAVDRDEGTNLDGKIFIEGTQAWSLKTLKSGS